MNMYWESGGIAPRIIILGGDESSASRPDRFTPRETISSTNSTGDSVGLKVGLDVVVQRRNPAPPGNWTLAVQPIA
jgi:hypothetical protein